MDPEQFINEQWARFTQMCPDFDGSPENAEALVRHLETPPGLFPTAQELRVAHAMAWRAGEYKPTQPVENRDPATMPIDDLRRIVNGETPSPPPEWTMPVEQLRPLALQAEREHDPVAAWRVGSEVAHEVPHGMSEPEQIPRSEDALYWDRQRAEDARK